MIQSGIKHNNTKPFTHALSALMAKIGSCKLEKGYCYLIDNYQSKLKVNTKTDCREYQRFASYRHFDRGNSG
jgi:hypothetical protein